MPKISTPSDPNQVADTARSGFRASVQPVQLSRQRIQPHPHQTAHQGAVDADELQTLHSRRNLFRPKPERFEVFVPNEN